jgi:hypothetical protein
MNDHRSHVAFWPPVKELLIHVLIGLAFFVVIAAAAVSLDVLVNFLTSKGINDTVVAGLKLTEYALFAIDVLLLILYVGTIALRMLMDLWRSE